MHSHVFAHLALARVEKALVGEVMQHVVAESAHGPLLDSHEHVVVGYEISAVGARAIVNFTLSSCLLCI